MATVSTLSLMARAIREDLQRLFNPTGLAVIIDNPANAAQARTAGSASLLNVFFYRFEPSGFDAGAGPLDRWFVRARCLITAFSVEGVRDGVRPETVSEGEMDLAVLGEVLRHFHQHPAIFIEDTIEKFPVRAHLNIMLNPLSSEEINQIWSTQGGVAYRPSLLYEIALVSIEARVEPAEPKLVAETLVGVRATTSLAARKAKHPASVEGAGG